MFWHPLHPIYSNFHVESEVKKRQLFFFDIECVFDKGSFLLMERAIKKREVDSKSGRWWEEEEEEETELYVGNLKA